MSGDFNSTRVVKARKAWRCDECGREVSVGECYESTAAVWQGDFFTNRACLHCAAARRIVNNASDYYGDDYYEGLSEWLGGNAAEAWSLRLLIGFSRRWSLCYSDGLMPVPVAP